MEKLAPDRWRVSGTMRLDDFRREFPALGDVDEVETMGGIARAFAWRGAGGGRIGNIPGFDPHRGGRRRAARPQVDCSAGEIKWIRTSSTGLFFAACLGPSVSVVRHGSGRVRAEPLARAAAGARGQALGQTCCTASRKSGKVHVDDSLVGNTLANFIILGWTVAKLHEWFLGSAPGTSAFSRSSFFVLRAVRFAAQNAVRAYPNQLCLSAATPFRPIHFVLGPLVVIVEDVSRLCCAGRAVAALTGRLFGNREEMLAVMQESAQALTTDERAMINRVLDLQTFTVRQIATPLAQTVTIETQTPIADVLALARERKLSRLPVREMRDGHPRIAGMLMLGPLLFRDDLDLQNRCAHMTPALFLVRTPGWKWRCADAARRRAAGHRAGPGWKRAGRRQSGGHFQADVR